ncbi:DUF7344 domain-containing protein [Halorarius halobius]|uniref:DUF7344 domain-containing protein n=1 Tax=Halorarius halobius TaxID=2962671 RepID=UPI0020CDCB5A|nr:hypothetical protein [Halorarius halobius]
MPIDAISSLGVAETASQESDRGISQETAFETLSSERRRYTLHYLLQRDDPVTLRELSAQIAAWENDTVRDAVTYKERMRVYTALRQSHLPMMADNGIVRFDTDRSVVELTPEASELEVYFDVVPTDSISWSSYYLGLGALSVGVVAADLVGLLPFTLVPAIAWSALIAATFTTSAGVHFLRDRRMRLGREGPPPTNRGDGP